MTFKTVKHIFLGLGLLISCNALYGAADDPNDAIQQEIEESIIAVNNILNQNGMGPQIINMYIPGENGVVFIRQNNALFRINMQHEISEIKSHTKTGFINGALGGLILTFFNECFTDSPNKIAAIEALLTCLYYKNNINEDRLRQGKAYLTQRAFELMHQHDLAQMQQADVKQEIYDNFRMAAEETTLIGSLIVTTAASALIKWIFKQPSNN